MKKIYSLALFLFAALAINAQVNVVFSVDMNDVALSDNDIVTLGGDFQSWAPGAEVFDDADGNGVYVFTYEIMPGQSILYKFVVNTWGTNEFGEGAVAGDCNMDDGAGNINRTFTVPADAEGTIMLPTYIYDSCEISELPVNTNNISTIQGVKFTPNPASDMTLISFENANNEAHQIIVTSMTGQVVSSLVTTGNTAELSVADFASGMYFVTFRNEAGEQGTEKLMVK